MGAINHEQEYSSSIPPTRLFKAIVLDGDNLVQKCVPGAFKSIETLHGDGGAGTIKSISFSDASQYKTIKHRIDEIDEANLVYKYSVIEGDVLGDEVDSISYTAKYEAGPDGGSVVKTTSTYHTKKDAHNIVEAKFNESKEKAKALFHAIEAHLHAHPHEYI